jgi:hypothetical protein
MNFPNRLCTQLVALRGLGVVTRRLESWNGGFRYAQRAGHAP